MARETPIKILTYFFARLIPEKNPITLSVLDLRIKGVREVDRSTCWSACFLRLHASGKTKGDHKHHLCVVWVWEDKRIHPDTTKCSDIFTEILIPNFHWEPPPPKKKQADQVSGPGEHYQAIQLEYFKDIPFLQETKKKEKFF